MSKLSAAVEAALKAMQASRTKARMVVPNHGWGQFGSGGHLPGWKAVHTAMPPDEFLRFTGSPIDGSGWLHEPSVMGLLGPISEGATMRAWPTLSFESPMELGKKMQIIAHDGRHRALASKLLGIDRIPVALEHSYGSRVPDWEPWMFEQAKDRALWIPQRGR